jgi:hypothetical protein
LPHLLRLSKKILVNGPTRGIGGISSVVCGALRPPIDLDVQTAGRDNDRASCAFRSLKLSPRPRVFQPVRKIVVNNDRSVPLHWHSAKFVNAYPRKSTTRSAHTMRHKHSERSIRGQFPLTGLAIVAILVLVLLGGLFHHHESASDSAACSYCHAGVQTPVVDLAGALVTPSFAAVGSVAPAQPSDFPRISHFSTLVPRAPPVPNHPLMFWEGCVGLV